jgi:hypothetical protein
VPLEGPVLAFVQLNASALSANINAAGLGPGVYTLTPQVTVPPDLSIVGPLPDVTLTLRAPTTPTPPLLPTATPSPIPEALPNNTPTIPPPEAPGTSEPPPGESGETSEEVPPSPTPAPPPDSGAALPIPPASSHQGVA